jgi:hypothetical protein
VKEIWPKIVHEDFPSPLPGLGPFFRLTHGCTMGYFLTRLRRWDIGQHQPMRDFIKAKPEFLNQDIGVGAL